MPIQIPEKTCLTCKYGGAIECLEAWKGLEDEPECPFWEEMP